ncbi:MAG: DNA polymerase III subunit alpha [Clostridia bacterium]
MGRFVHLHNHTEFSLLDGIAKIKKLVEVAAGRGDGAVAITDHGNMYGVLQFYKTCLEKQIKPIIGCEFYCCHDREAKSGRPDTAHLILLAKNDIGYHNLLKLQTVAYLEGFYYKPRIDYKALEKRCEGLICLSGCLAGHIPQMLLSGNETGAEELAVKLRDMFAPGDFYIELQNHGLPEQIEILPKLYNLAKKIGVKVVATNDCHYIAREDAEMQDVLLCVQMGKQIDDPDRMKFTGSEFYVKSYDEMLEAMKGFEESLATTIEIADKCDVTIRSKAHGEIHDVKIDDKYILPASKNFIPTYKTDNGQENFEFLQDQTYKGIVKKYGEITPALKERADYELKVIHDQGFVDYFLVVWDYVNYAREHDIPVGPGRGSGAGSLVAYAISITLVDPIKYDLIFERFIHKERVSMPDFDVDFCMDRRMEVVEYVRQRYSPTNVSMIVTFGTMAAKNAIRDVARVLRMPYSEVDKLTKPIPAKLPDGIKKPPVLKYYFGTTGKEEDKRFIIPELRKIFDEDEFVRKVVSMAIKLEGSPRNCSTHAAGVLIAPGPVDDYVAVSKNGEDVSTQANMIELEELGLLKMDFLGLRTLTDIDKAIKMIKKNKGIDVDFYAMDYNDPEIYSLIGSGNTEAIFQLESGGMKKFMAELKPTSLEDIIAGISLYRPGPMDSIPKYIHNKEHPDEIVYEDPCLENILNVTYGCIVYQEQVMKVVQVMAGFNLGQADNVRRIMSKKKKDKMVYEKEKFINGWEDPKGISSIPGAIKKGISKEVAEKVWGEMESFASYAFNKSHAAAYAYLSYQTAYLKRYHLVEFLCAVINNRINNIDEIKHYCLYAKTEKIDILPPDVNKSETYFSTENGAIRFGLAGLKNVGIGVVEGIIKERTEHGEFKSFEDFVSRVPTQAQNKKCLESLIFAGAFDSFKAYRSQLMQIYEMIVDRVAKDKKSISTGQFSLFDGSFDGVISQKPVELPNIKEFSLQTKLKFEKDIVGLYISGHPLDQFIDKMSSYNFDSRMLETEKEDEIDDQAQVEETTNEDSLADGTNVICGGIIVEIKKVLTRASKSEMAILTIEDLYGNFEAMLFPKQYERYGQVLEEDMIVSLRGKYSKRDGQSAIILAENITICKKEEESPQSENEKPATQKLCLRFDMQDADFLEKITSILSAYQGESEVLIQSSKEKKLYKLKYLVRICDPLLAELEGKLSKEDIKVI